MKKMLALLLTVCLVLSMAGCGAKTETPKTDDAAQAAEWSRDGYFMDDNGNMLSVVYMEDVDEPGWYAGCMLGEDPVEDSWGGIIAQEGNTLHGELPSSGSKDPITVTISEEGEDGLQLVVEGGETYHFVSDGMEEAAIIVTIDTEGWGNIAYAEGDQTPEVDEEYPYQSAQINLASPETYTLLAWPQVGSLFVKWTKNGEDYSTDAQITVELDESTDFVAVFKEDPDYQNPIMNFVGEYQCDRAHAKVEPFGNDQAWILIEWAGSVSEVAQWDIVGSLDTETLTITYKDSTKSHVTYEESGDAVSQEMEYENGTGTIVFGTDGTFTWHEDQSETGQDMVFEWVDVEENGEEQ